MVYDVAIIWLAQEAETISHNGNLQLQKLPETTFKVTWPETVVLVVISIWLWAQHLDIEMIQLRDAH